MNITGQTASAYNSEAYQDPTPKNNSIFAGGANVTGPSFHASQL